MPKMPMLAIQLEAGLSATNSKDSAKNSAMATIHVLASRAVAGLKPRGMAPAT